VEVPTDATGAFRVGGLGSGNFLVALSVGGREWFRREVGLGPAERVALEVDLPREAEGLEGIVVRDGLPFSGARVFLGDGQRWRAITGAGDGRFRTAGLAAGESYSVRASARDADGVTYVSDPTTAVAGSFLVLELQQR